MDSPDSRALSARERLHTHAVAGLRLALPIAALGALSTLFLFARDIDPSRAVSLARVDAEDLIRDPRATTPHLGTVTVDGTAVTLISDTMRISSGEAETITAEDVVVTFTTPDGQVNRVVADHGTLDREADLLTLTGNMVAVTSTGFVVRSDLMLAAIDRSFMESPGPVEGDGPPGWLEAGAFVMHGVPSAQGDGFAHHLLFTDGVRLIYVPGRGD